MDSVVVHISETKHNIIGSAQLGVPHLKTRLKHIVQEAKELGNKTPITCRLEMATEKVTSIVQLITEIGIGITRVTVKPPAQSLETEATLEQDPGALVTGATVVVRTVAVGTVLTVEGEAKRIF